MRLTIVILLLIPAAVQGAVFDISLHDPERDRTLATTVYLPEMPAPCPVIVFSHGLGRSRGQYAYLGQHWSGCGYAVVMVEHPGSNDDVWRGKLRPRRALREAFESPATSLYRPQDLSFVIDRLVEQQRAGSELGRRLDLTRIAVAGNDLGAEAALCLAGQMRPSGVVQIDRRVRAVVAMSPPAPRNRMPVAGTLRVPISMYDRVYANVAVPCLHITGTADDGRVGDTKAHQRRIAFDHIRGADQFLVTLVGADHAVYCFHPRQPSRAVSDTRYHRLILAATTAFWNAYLKGDDAARASLAAAGLGPLLGPAAIVEQK